MLRIKILTFCLCLIICFGCKSKIKPPSISEENVQYVGAIFADENAVDYQSLLGQLKKEDLIENTTVKGKVVSVCQAKGCWMNLTAHNGDEMEPIFVKFKDYAFFVPKDLSGESVVLHGKAYKEVTSVDELRHYAEDEGKSKDFIASITEPKEEYKFMADGVILSDR